MTSGLQSSSPTAETPLIAVDISKAASRDGLGSYIRHLLHALIEITSDGAPAGHRRTPARFLLLNLLGAASGEELAEKLGKVPRHVELDLERWQGKTAAEQRNILARADALLATSWILPAAAPPSLFVVYDLTFLSHPQTHTLHNRLHCTEGLLRARLSGAAWTTISKASAGELTGHLGVPPERILIAAPGVGRHFKPPGPGTFERVVERHGLGRVEGFVLSVGSLEPRKNLSRLLAAHARLDLETRRAYPLCLVGAGGWRKSALEGRLAKAEAGTLFRLDNVSEVELVELFGAATVFVYPSLAEGFGLPVLEAMACETPVITSNLSSLPEVAGDAALLIDPLKVDGLADAIDRLLHDSQARLDLVRRGQERLGTFSWQRSADQLLRRLLELAASS